MGTAPSEKEQNTGSHSLGTSYLPGTATADSPRLDSDQSTITWHSSLEPGTLKVRGKSHIKGSTDIFPICFQHAGDSLGWNNNPQLFAETFSGVYGKQKVQVRQAGNPPPLGPTFVNGCFLGTCLSHSMEDQPRAGGWGHLAGTTAPHTRSEATCSSVCLEYCRLPSLRRASSWCVTRAVAALPAWLGCAQGGHQLGERSPKEASPVVGT